MVGAATQPARTGGWGAPPASALVPQIHRTVNPAYGPDRCGGPAGEGRASFPAYFSGCNTAADCVPGGCTGPGGYCLGTIDVPGQVSCTNTIGAYVVCAAEEGCSVPKTGQVECGDGTGTGTGAITCDGPSDCPVNNDCCNYPAGGAACRSPGSAWRDWVGVPFCGAWCSVARPVRSSQPDDELSGGQVLHFDWQRTGQFHLSMIGQSGSLGTHVPKLVPPAAPHEPGTRSAARARRLSDQRSQVQRRFIPSL